MLSPSQVRVIHDSCARTDILGLIAVSLNYLLQGTLGFGWAIRVTAFICFALLLLGNLLLFDSRSGPEASATLPDGPSILKASESPINDSEKAVQSNVESERAADDEPSKSAPLLDRKYARILIQGFLTGLGLWFPSSYVQLFAEKNGVDKQLTFFSLAILNVANALGRILPNWLSDRWGALEVYVPCLVLNCTYVLL